MKCRLLIRKVVLIAKKHKEENPGDLSIFRGLRGVLKNPPVASNNTYRARGVGRVDGRLRRLVDCLTMRGESDDHEVSQQAQFSTFKHISQLSHQI